MPREDFDSGPLKLCRLAMRTQDKHRASGTEESEVMTPLGAGTAGGVPSSPDLGLAAVEPGLKFPSCVPHSLSGVVTEPQLPGIPRDLVSQPFHFIEKSKAQQRKG